MNELRTTKGVICTHCGASTPLPDDTRVPTFTCQYCHTVLQTVAYAGLGAVRADAMKSALAAAARGEAPSEAPQPLVHGGTGSRTMACVHCRASLDVPLAVTVPRVTCGQCGKTEPVSRYISDAERLALDMQRQQAGNAAMAALLQKGIDCDRCGAPNAVPQPVPVQVICTACQHPILLAGRVAADAVDRARLRESVLAMRDAMQTKATDAKRINLYVTLGVFALIVVIAVVALVAL